MGNKFVQRNLQSSWFIGTINFRDLVSSQRFATKSNLGSRNGKNLVNVFFNLLIVPSDNRSNSEVLQFSSCCKFFDFINKTGFSPVFMYKDNRLS